MAPILAACVTEDMLKHAPLREVGVDAHGGCHRERHAGKQRHAWCSSRGGAKDTVVSAEAQLKKPPAVTQWLEVARREDRGERLGWYCVEQSWGAPRGDPCPKRAGCPGANILRAHGVAMCHVPFDAI